LEWIGALITAVKNAGPPIYAAVLIATLLLLLLPDHVVAQIGLDEFVKSYRMYIGIGLIASASLLSVHILSAVASFLLEPLEAWRLNRTGLRTLQALTEAEKEFIRPYIRQGENTRYTSVSNGVAQGLVAKGLLYRASTLSIPGGQFPFNLQPYARALLQKQPTLLD
jgi:superinfection exclusion protein B